MATQNKRTARVRAIIVEKLTLAVVACMVYLSVLTVLALAEYVTRVELLNQ